MGTVLLGTKLNVASFLQLKNLFPSPLSHTLRNHNKNWTKVTSEKEKKKQDNNVSILKY